MGDKIDFPGATIIEGDDDMRARKCLQIIENTLKLYRCLIIPTYHFEGLTIIPGIKVVAIPDKVPGEEPPKGG